MRELGGTQWPPKGHRVSKWRSWESKPGRLDPSLIFNHCPFTQNEDSVAPAYIADSLAPGDYGSLGRILFSFIYFTQASNAFRTYNENIFRKKASHPGLFCSRSPRSSSTHLLAAGQNIQEDWLYLH
jgi:hypothetical protein